MPSSKLNPPAILPPPTHEFNSWRSKTVSWGVVDGPRRGPSCTWLHGAARPCRRGSPAEGSSTPCAPRPRDAAMARSGRRRGGRQLAAGNAGTVILCMYVAAAAAAAAPGVMCQQSCTRADLLLDDDGAPSRRSTESGERDTERERARDPAPPPPGGGLSRDGGLCEASSFSGELTSASPVLPRRRVGAAHPLAFVLRRTPGATSHSPHTPSGDGSVRVN